MIMTPEQIIKEGQFWIESNEEAWIALKSRAAKDAQERPDVVQSISRYIEILRADWGISVPNTIRAYLARKIKQEVPQVNFVFKTSKIDKWVPIPKRIAHPEKHFTTEKNYEVFEKAIDDQDDIYKLVAYWTKEMFELKKELCQVKDELRSIKHIS